MPTALSLSISFQLLLTAYGTGCYDDGSVDRSHANLGEPDESKFKIVLPTRKTNPNGGAPIQGQRAVYTEVRAREVAQLSAADKI
jgi:hypothetical protein